MNINEKKYGDLSEAVAFVIRFAFMIYSYDDIAPIEFYTELCSRCHKRIQSKDFLAPKSSCKKEYGVLDIMEFGISEQIKNELTSHFDITEEDFRPVRNKKGEIVYYQITPQHVLESIALVNKMKALKPCKKCGRVQYRMKEHRNKNGKVYHYISKEALENMSDINRTSEEFHCFSPEYVVSRRVYDYLIERYPRMIFEPVFLKEEFI